MKQKIISLIILSLRPGTEHEGDAAREMAKRLASNENLNYDALFSTAYFRIFHKRYKSPAKQKPVVNGEEKKSLVSLHTIAKRHLYVKLSNTIFVYKGNWNLSLKFSENGQWELSFNGVLVKESTGAKSLDIFLKNITKTSATSPMVLSWVKLAMKYGFILTDVTPEILTLKHNTSELLIAKSSYVTRHESFWEYFDGSIEHNGVSRQQLQTALSKYHKKL